MAIDSVTTGPNQRPIDVIGDPSSASALLSVGQSHNGDGQTIGGSIYSIVAATVNMLYNGSTFDRQRSAAGTTGIPAINFEGTKATYSYSISGFTPAATATDILQILGSASKTVRVTRVSVTGLATSAATNDLLLIKRSSSNTGGTTAAVTAAQHDSNDPAPTGSVNSYSANPSALGTSAGQVRGAKLNLGAAGAAGIITWDFTTRNSKGIVLRGSAQQLCLNWNGAAVPAGTSLDIEIEVTEE